MAILPIVTYNDPILRSKTTPVPELNEEVDELISDMIETMYHSDGIGLAAPQIGKSIRIFVMDPDPVLDDDEEKPGTMVFINPQIIEKTGKKIPMDEGCLSIPEVTDKVFRPERVKVRYLDRNFKEKELEAQGWIARIIMHEYDHLEGILFIDYLSAFRRRMLRSDLKEIEQGERETNYPLVPKLPKQ